MDKEELKRRAKNPRNIPGIFNYCDMWCERCEFTERCLVYSVEEERKEAADGSNQDQVIEKVTESLDIALSLLQDLAEEEGIDLDAMESEEDEAETPVVHILSLMSRTYIDMADRWFERNPFLEEEGLRETPPHLELIHPKPVAASVRELVQVIRFDQHHIHAKLARALMSRRDEKDLNIEDLPRDQDGSAKVALIELDRSIGAWWELCNAFRDQEKGILQIIRHLKHIRDIAEREFPNARAFIRPGFDEV
jgi:hypothetical protein